jgi:phosphoribosylaminoimidazolecarboxamide formyltransferase/IMP cyclohydrolase
MTDLIAARRALISLSDKSGLDQLAEGLKRHGIELVSTGGTAARLRELGHEVRDISDLTGFPEMMDGRVKTLHPNVHGGLLGVRDNAEHVEAMERHGIAPIDLVIVNLYPFEATVARGADRDEIIENIDIGGPSMVRSSAKNHAFVGIVTDPADYEELVGELDANGGKTSLALRRRLAAKAYALTAAYDSMISQWFAFADQGERFPSSWTFSSKLKMPLRYGENPHQRAALYIPGGARWPDPSGDRRRYSGPGSRQWHDHGRPAEMRDRAPADRARAARLHVRLDRSQACEVQCDRLR